MGSLAYPLANGNAAIVGGTINGATIGATSASTGAFTTGTFTTSGSQSTVTITDTGANGANLKLAGSGGTTPNKHLRAAGGNLEFVNSAYNGVVATLSDAGAYGAVGSLTANNGTAIPAGGTAGAGLKVSSATNFGVFFGSGAPTLTAAKGSLYLRSDGSSTSTRMYVNTDGSTAWTNVTTAA